LNPHPLHEAVVSDIDDLITNTNQTGSFDLTDGTCVLLVQADFEGADVTVTEDLTSLPANFVLKRVEIVENNSGTLTNSTEAGPSAFLHVQGNQGGRFSYFNGLPPDGAKFLVCDEDFIDPGLPPNFFSDIDVSDGMEVIGFRTQLAFFAANEGLTITMHTGEVGDEGCFAPQTIPASWDAAEPDPAVPTGDGLRHFVGNPSLAFPHNLGPGLGTADSNGDREALLDKIPQSGVHRSPRFGQRSLHRLPREFRSFLWAPWLDSQLGLLLREVLGVRGQMPDTAAGHNL
jgi:hypothetical protein